MSIFYENYLKLCAARQESPTAVSKKIGLSNAAATGWKKGKKPSEVTLEKLAVYFGVAREDLTGEEQKEKPTPSEESELNAHAKAILYKYEQLNPAQRVMFEKMLDAALEAAKGKENG